MKHPLNHILSILLTVFSFTAFSQPGPETTKVWIIKSVDHYFSSPETKDHFMVAVQGSSIVSGEFVFAIKDADKKLLFTETHPTAALLGMSQPKSKRQTEKMIRERVNTFFDESNFTDPAIKSDEEYSPEQSDKTTWDEIKEDSTAVGFFFLIDKANGRSIAWSKKQKKVVIYMSCC